MCIRDSSNYEQYFNEQTTFQQYSEWLTGEFTALAYGSSTYEQNNMKNFMHILSNSEFIGVNKKFSQKPNVNETLVAVSYTHLTLPTKRIVLCLVGAVSSIYKY
eukprot:TRINITY_DN11424_c0_g1_i2.p2 TRINITY_DN11424_c0_g1~~TRINITY_DN11424_c0_g1_i2.p2  ORF type:complete len:104 (+),score=16.21 TRINITY_DN11424_c0_g1_i2:90-401(+)